ncbi:hypothetical protein TPAR_02843 [Tolypocladium paradoxum]|uniref:Uncharacterized protein n=1 Tax=Tolypocladium paradoxum TaxID=94208 RepID=A0A2S4L3C8_9HYPO|nr:hypothetical protein TPAR_02843 [Tolypocladium paradoxum]
MVAGICKLHQANAASMHGRNCKPTGTQLLSSATGANGDWELSDSSVMQGRAYVSGPCHATLPELAADSAAVSSLEMNKDLEGLIRYPQSVTNCPGNLEASVMGDSLHAHAPQHSTQQPSGHPKPVLIRYLFSQARSTDSPEKQLAVQPIYFPPNVRRPLPFFFLPPSSLSAPTHLNAAQNLQLVCARNRQPPLKLQRSSSP